MQVIGIKELQVNPGKLTRAFSDNDYLLITKHGLPVGMALPFSEHIMDQGLMPWFAVRAFQSGDLSLGQLGKALSKNRHETIRLLGQLGIPVADYDFEEDLAAVERLLAA